MPNEMTTFTTPAALGGVSIRTMGPVDRPIFIVLDVAKVLGRGDGRHLTRGLPPDEKGVTVCHTPGGPQKLAYVTEAGLYRILMRSNSPKARAFQDWLARDVLPAIRKDGGYIMGEEKLNDPNLTADDLDALNDQLIALHRRKEAVLEAKVAAQAARIADLEPIEAAFNRLAGTDGIILTSDVARLVDLKEDDLFSRAKAFGMIFHTKRGWRGYAEYRTAPKAFLFHKVKVTAFGASTQLYWTLAGVTWLGLRLAKQAARGAPAVTVGHIQKGKAA